MVSSEDCVLMACNLRGTGASPHPCGVEETGRVRAEEE